MEELERNSPSLFSTPLRSDRRVLAGTPPYRRKTNPFLPCHSKYLSACLGRIEKVCGRPSANQAQQSRLGVRTPQFPDLVRHRSRERSVPRWPECRGSWKTRVPEVGNVEFRLARTLERPGPALDSRSQNRCSSRIFPNLSIVALAQRVLDASAVATAKWPRRAPKSLDIPFSSRMLVKARLLYSLICLARHSIVRRPSAVKRRAAVPGRLEQE